MLKKAFDLLHSVQWAPVSSISLPKAFSFQCMTEFTTNKKNKLKKKGKEQKKKKAFD